VRGQEFAKEEQKGSLELNTLHPKNATPDVIIIICGPISGILSRTNFMQYRNQHNENNTRKDVHL